MPTAQTRNRSQTNDSDPPSDLSVTVDELLDDPAFADIGSIYDMYGSFDDAVPAPLIPQRSICRKAGAKCRPLNLVIDTEAAQAESPNLGVQIVCNPIHEDHQGSLSPEPLKWRKHGSQTGSTTSSLTCGLSSIETPLTTCYGGELPEYLRSQWSPRPKGISSTVPRHGSRLLESDYGSRPTGLDHQQKRTSDKTIDDYDVNLSYNEIFASSTKAFEMLPPRPSRDLLGGDRSLGSFFDHEPGFTPSQSSGTPDNALSQSQLWQQYRQEDTPQFVHPVIKSRDLDDDGVYPPHDRTAYQERHHDMAMRPEKHIHNVDRTDFDIMGPFVLESASKPTSSLFDLESNTEQHSTSENGQDVKQQLDDNSLAFIQLAAPTPRLQIKPPSTELFPSLVETLDEKLDRLEFARRLAAGPQKPKSLFCLKKDDRVRQVHLEITWHRLCGVDESEVGEVTRWPERPESLPQVCLSSVVRMDAKRMESREEAAATEEGSGEGGLKRSKSLRHRIFGRRKDRG